MAWRQAGGLPHKRLGYRKWRVDCLFSGGGEARNGGDIVTTNDYSEFEVEWTL